MTEPFVGEVQIFGFGFAPRNWSYANGALVSIRQSTALYALLGTQFGGDGVTTFGLPNLVTRATCGAGQSPGNSQRTIGQAFGTAAVSLASDQMPLHNHTLSDYQTDAVGGQIPVPAATSALAFNENVPAFAAPGATTTMNPNAIGAAGAGAAHENRQPFLALNHCIALVGTYPYFD